MRRHALNLGNALWSGPVGPLRYPEVPITGAITLGSSAWNRMHVCSGTSADYTVGLPACAGHAGDVIGFRMATGLTKLVMLDGNASELLNGTLTRTMWAGESVVLLCDGSHWFKIEGQRIPMIASAAMGTGVTLLNATATTMPITGTVIDNTGLMVDATNDMIIIPRTGIYQIAGIIGFNPLALACSAGYIEIFVGALSAVQNFFFTVSTSVYTRCGIVHIVPLTAGDTLKLSVTHSSGGTEVNGFASLFAATEVPAW